MCRSLSRRGFTLAELLVALTLAGIVAAAAHRMLAGSHRTYRAETLRIDRDQSLRAAASILPVDLRELNARDGDILAMSPTSITIRAMRQLAFTCATLQPGPTASLTVRHPFFGVRDFDPEVDSLLIHVDGDAWVPAGLSAEGGGTCADGAPGRVLTVHLPAQQGSTALGAPIRGFEIVTYRLYRASDGLWHIGLLDRAGGTIQPLIGPVAPDGFELTYYDSAGAGTSLPERVSVIELKVRAGTVEPVRAAGALVRPLDSVVVVVALRNNPRF